MVDKQEKEVIKSDEIIKRGKVSVDEPPSQMLKTKAALVIAIAALVIGVGFLIAALWMADNELKVWATGLISLVVGAAIGFVFSSSTSS